MVPFINYFYYYRWGTSRPTMMIALACVSKDYAHLKLRLIHCFQNIMENGSPISASNSLALIKLEEKPNKNIIFLVN